MQVRNWKLVILLVILGVITSACSITTSSTSTSGEVVDNSLFVSSNSGDSWQAMVNVPTTGGRAQSISSFSINTMSMDPQDSLAVYLGTFDHGLYYTYNVTNGWNYVNSLPSATINDVKVDPRDKCIIYAAIGNRVYRSSDCSRNWTQIYFDSNPNLNVTSIVVDHYNTHNIYIGTSRGEIIKSIDSGNSWRTIQRMDDGIASLIASPSDSRVFFVATVRSKLFRFSSNTNTNAADSADIEQNFIVENWTDLNGPLADYNIGTSFKNLMIVPTDGMVYLATEKAILRSIDNGDSWQNIKLIPSDKDTTINAFAVNPQDSSTFYYVTNNAFLKTTDGGTTWTTKNLPTRRAGKVLLVDFNTPTNIYLGTTRAKN